jgi:signal transduction histidine kinase
MDLVVNPEFTASASPGKSALATLNLRDEQDVVSLCRRTRIIGEQVGFDRHAVRRLSTAAYEVAQHLCGGGKPCPTAELTVAEGPSLQVDFHAVVPSGLREQVPDWVGPLYSMVHRLSVVEDRDAIRISLAMFWPGGGAALRYPVARPVERPESVRQRPRARDFAALKQAHRELQAELQETNRGVVDLYAELDDRAQRLLATENDLRRRAEELAAANRAKEEFLATLSHELRTPLNAMLGWTRLLRSGRLEPAMATRALETIERNARLQEQLIADILDLSRIVTGKLRVDLRPVALAPIVEAAVDAVRPTAEAKGVALETSAAEEPGKIIGDPDRLQQVIWNLVANAIKFTPTGGSVTIAFGRQADQAVMIVRDTGEGIAPDLLPFIFDRFWQGDTSVTRPHGGLGLGLSIVRHIVELHGGRVSVHSGGLGHGTTFTVALPLQ